MVIHVSNQGKTQIIGHIIFPYNNIIKSIFLMERVSKQTTVLKNGKEITTEPISKKLSEILIKNGFELKPCDKIHLQGRNRVFGVSLNVAKSYKGKDIKELFITIKSSDAVNLARKQDALISNISKIIPDLKYKSSIADKFVEC